MRAKEYLSQLGKLERKIDDRKKHLEALKADIPYLRGMSYDGVRVQTSPSGECLAQKKVEQIADIEAALSREIAEYHHLRRKITLEIEQLQDLRFQEILIDRYVERMSLREIADDMGYEVSWVRKLHGRSINAFEVNLRRSKTV